jgi:hypothetical protein
MSIQTITTIDDNGNFPGDGGFLYRGGQTHFAVYGTFGGATVTIKASFEGDIETSPVTLPSSSTFISLTDEAGSPVSITADEIIKIDIGKCFLQFVATNATGTTDIKVKAS